MTVSLDTIVNDDEKKSAGSDFIEHYGVRGMKWGVRKAADRSRSASNWKARKDREREAKRESKRSGTSKTTSKASQPNVKKMSDDDLKKAVARMQMEKQYIQLKRELTPKTRGQKFTEAAMKAATEVALNQAKGAANAVIKKEVEKKLGIKTGKKGKKSKGTTWKP